MLMRCGACGSTKNVHAVYDEYSEGNEWRCTACINQRFPPGTRVVKFTDTAHPLHPAFYMSVETEDDLDLVLTVGERAQRMKAKGFKAFFYTAHTKGLHINSGELSLGHADSIIQLRSQVDKMRMWMETSRVIPTIRKCPQDDCDDEDTPPLFSPIERPLPSKTA
ncbi:MAG: hypothetical protein EAX95_03320 [Candidatus Thorarchaeota archaeon]|nr:hypothetical protein [Candidatus Thorarchaeota archaeon]